MSMSWSTTTRMPMLTRGGGRGCGNSDGMARSRLWQPFRQRSLKADRSRLAVAFSEVGAAAGPRGKEPRVNYRSKLALTAKAGILHDSLHGGATDHSMDRAQVSQLGPGVDGTGPAPLGRCGSGLVGAGRDYRRECRDGLGPQYHPPRDRGAEP